ncbi:probable N-acetylglucosaminyl-phosphatidylinositol de-N-acetylase isoform X1 [Andrographis paniculata]|uniref:probable N-acetylglucosaminyl-phosphatidylinositol de-N-acetylase isoform X1 n=1 Tax=Andrographis paniculata TaxID=175694 RepID=UPI0021E6DF8B|nr:probable N-acetylglucosaminyl-phosphatidylinositol de-N-acetylase isoform X1 [Andrographis paniculata]
MSKGNADGMGDVRKEELYLASAVLKIPTQQVKVLDHPDLQDGFGKVWNRKLLADIIDKETQALRIDSIITFDEYGVSGHCNHRDVHQGVRELLHEVPDRHLEAWALASNNILRKYIGPVDIWLSTLFAKRQGSHYLPNSDPRKTYAAMAQHSSQWVWYRKLFVTFSSYSYVNTLKKIN